MWAISWEGQYMKKDIYIIKNSINNKVYIGQSSNSAKRWLSHIYDARYEHKTGKKGQVIHRAMNKYGMDKFHYEILEYQIENYNEREQYWIKQYNSIAPNGYNVSYGGAGTGAGIESPQAIFKSEEELMKCISRISSSKKSFTNIAAEFGCSQEVISAINAGARYRIDSMEYPLRDTNTRYSDDLLKQIRYSLKYEIDLSLKDIANKFKVDVTQVSAINTGKIYYVFGEKYPLRAKRKTDIDDSIIKNIIDDIIHSTLCLSDIASKHNVSRSIVTNINKGNYHKQVGMNYPLRGEKDSRSHSLKKFLDIDEIREIHRLLKGKESINEIANKYGVTPTTIHNINNGRCKKYILEECKYPIRKNY